MRRAIHLGLSRGLSLLLASSTLVAHAIAQKGSAAGRGSLAAAARLYEDAVSEDATRGVVVLVAHRGKTVLHKAYGWRDADKKLPMRKDTLFRLASNTKPIVATAVLMLASDGKLEIAAPVGRYLPAFANDKCKSITVHQLLTHTSGLRIPGLFVYPLMQKSEAHPDAPTLQLEAARFASVGPAVEPGTSYKYSNAGFNTLGALVEKVSGMPLASFLRARIYDVLRMPDTCHHESVAVAERMSSVFRRRENGTWRVSWKPGGPATVPFVRASGGGISTAADYARFLQAWLDDAKPDRARRNGAPKRLLTQESIRAAAKPHTSIVYEREQRAQRRSFYGYGWVVRRDGTLEHGGSDGTWAWVDAKRDTLGIVFTQSTRDARLNARFRTHVRRALAED